jgi:uncharacterized protein (TIGR04255 family)
MPKKWRNNMPFPDTQRVIYRNNPLHEVVCQLRFPPILRIDAEVPAEFQDRIRQDFPDFSERKARIDIPLGARDEIPPEILGKIVQSTGVKNYQFSSEDGTWKISLTRTFLALTTNSYQRWEDFLNKLINPLGALVDVYSPNKYTRIGLRYINIIRRSSLNLGDADWTELLQPYVLGLLSAPEVRQQIQTFENKYDIILNDGLSKARMRTGFVKSSENEEICYKIDTDFFDERKTAIGSAMDRLEYLRKRGSRSFRWCITESLHEAMEPEAL